MDLLALVFRWIHILAAITAVGGAIFLRFALLPALTVLSDDDHSKLREAIRQRWAMWVHGAVGLLLASGLVNIGLKIAKYQLPPTYHMVFGIKFLLGIAIMVIAALLVGRSALAQSMRSNMKFWLNLNLALALILVCLSGFLRQMDLVRKPAPPTVTAVFEPERP